MISVPVNQEIEVHLINAFTSMQEAYKAAITEFCLFEVKSNEDADILDRLSHDASLLFNRYLQLHTDAKMYSVTRKLE